MLKPLRYQTRNGCDQLDKIDKDKLLSEQSLRALIDINKDLAEEIDRLNRIIDILANPMSVSPATMKAIMAQRRTRRLEGIYSAVARHKDEEVN